jgi:hypothetical protein
VSVWEGAVECRYGQSSASGGKFGLKITIHRFPSDTVSPSPDARRKVPDTV